LVFFGGTALVAWSQERSLSSLGEGWRAS